MFKRKIQKDQIVPGMKMHACNPTTQEAEAGQSQVQGQAGQVSKTLSQK